MIYFIRHSERLNYVDKKIWIKLKRHQENRFDLGCHFVISFNEGVIL